jgi:hypothetical protein
MITIYRYSIGNQTIETIDLATIPENISYETFEYEEQQIETPIEVPQEVALWKIRAIIKSMGLEEQIEQSFELLEEPNKTGAKYIWEYGTAIERQSQTVLFLQQVLQMPEEQVDNIFINANNITL